MEEEGLLVGKEPYIYRRKKNRSFLGKSDPFGTVDPYEYDFEPTPASLNSGEGLINKVPLTYLYEQPKNPSKLSTITNNCLLQIWAILRFNIPILQIPLVPCLIVIIGLLIIGGGLLKGDVESTVEGIEIYRWCFYMAASAFIFILISVCISLFVMILGSLPFATHLHYYVNFIGIPLTVFIWSIVMLIIVPILIINWNTELGGYIEKVLKSLVSISISYIPFRLFSKYSILKNNKNNFWGEMREYLMRERLVYNLCFSRLNKLFDPNIENLSGPDSNAVSTGEREMKTVLGNRLSFSRNRRLILDPIPTHFNKVWQYILESPINDSAFDGFERGIPNGRSENEFNAPRQKENLTYEMASKQKKEQQKKTDTIAINITNTIFDRFDSNHKSYLNIQDFQRMGKSFSEIQREYSMIPKRNENEIQKLELLQFVKQVLNDKTRLHKTLFDRENLESLLHYICMCIWAVINLFSVLLIFGLNVQQMLLPFGTVFLGLSFIFGNSFRRMWEGFMEIFVIRPFDVGDRVTLVGYPTLIVNSIGLLSCEFYSPDGRMWIIHNDILFNSAIVQYKRSRDFAVNFVAELDANTKSDILSEIKSNLKKWMVRDSQINSTPWKIEDDGDWLVFVSAITNSNKLSLTVWIELEGINWSSPSAYAIPQSRLLVALQGILDELGVGYCLPVQPFRNVDIDDKRFFDTRAYKKKILDKKKDKETEQDEVRDIIFI